jgi:hypothetical protein
LPISSPSPSAPHLSTSWSNRYFSARRSGFNGYFDPTVVLPTYILYVHVYLTYIYPKKKRQTSATVYIYHDTLSTHTSLTYSLILHIHIHISIHIHLTSPMITPRASGDHTPIPRPTGNMARQRLHTRGARILVTAGVHQGKTGTIKKANPMRHSVIFANGTKGLVLRSYCSFTEHPDSLPGKTNATVTSHRMSRLSSAICDFPRENEELQLEQELSRQSDSKIGTT